MLPTVRPVENNLALVKMVFVNHAQKIAQPAKTQLFAHPPHLRILLRMAL